LPPRNPPPDSPKVENHLDLPDLKPRRLDRYRHGGDSLQARFHLLRLHPLSVAEPGLTTPAELPDLLDLGGFPEP
jgi:hypothetical protein